MNDASSDKSFGTIKEATYVVHPVLGESVSSMPTCSVIIKRQSQQSELIRYDNSLILSGTRDKNGGLEA